MHPSPYSTTHTAIGGTVVFSTLHFQPTDDKPDAECKVVAWIRQPGRGGLLVACSVPTGTGTKGFEAAQAMRRRLSVGSLCAAYGDRLAKPKPRPDKPANPDGPDLILRGCSYIRSAATIHRSLHATTARYTGPASGGSIFDEHRPLPSLADEFLPTMPFPRERTRAAA